MYLSAMDKTSCTVTQAEYVLRISKFKKKSVIVYSQRKLAGGKTFVELHSETALQQSPKQLK